MFANRYLKKATTTERRALTNFKSLVTPSVSSFAVILAFSNLLIVPVVWVAAGIGALVINCCINLNTLLNSSASLIKNWPKLKIPCTCLACLIKVCSEELISLRVVMILVGLTNLPNCCIWALISVPKKLPAKAKAFLKSKFWIVTQTERIVVILFWSFCKSSLGICL